MRNFLSEWISAHRSCESKERTAERSLAFSAEVRKKGRVHCDSLARIPGTDVGMQLGKWTAHDMDWCFRDVHRNLVIFVEVKTYGKRSIPYGEEALLEMMGTGVFKGYENLGAHVLVFSGSCSEDSNWIEFDDRNITSNELWDILNFIDVLEEEANNLSNKYGNE